MDGKIIKDHLNQNLIELEKSIIMVEESEYAANGLIHIDKYKNHITVPVNKDCTGYTRLHIFIKDNFFDLSWIRDMK